LLALLDALQDAFGGMAVVLGVVEQEAQLLELALHEAEAQVLALVLEDGGVELTLEARELLRRRTGRDVLARGGELLLRLLVRLVGIQPILLGLDLVLEAADLAPVAPLL